jgi:hypothetical protein
MGQRVGPQVGGIAAVEVVAGQKPTPIRTVGIVIPVPLFLRKRHGPYPC